MPSLSARVDIANRAMGAYRQALALPKLRIEAATLIASDRAAYEGQQRIRNAMRAAGLGRLGNALGQTSDLQKTGRVHRRANGFSASGIVYARSRSERTLGTLQSYTKGTQIRPVRGRWLWIATKDIPRVSNRERMTPELWKKNGWDAKIGPLEMIMGINGRPLLVVKNVGTSIAGKSRSARRLNKNGRPAKNQRLRSFLVAFVAIPFTARSARVDVDAIMASVRRELPRIYTDALRSTL